ncbi:hypothetical protein [Pseudokineococcus sp. 1T1Z-3]|uniref:hypothetical protein n=1 Tax=Pseudokineococcus sp. 1T1Z-3 TaxID=3132745 RepID=UPI0030DD73C4
MLAAAVGASGALVLTRASGQAQRVEDVQLVALRTGLEPPQAAGEDGSVELTLDALVVNPREDAVTIVGGGAGDLAGEVPLEVALVDALGQRLSPDQEVEVPGRGSVTLAVSLAVPCDDPPEWAPSVEVRTASGEEGRVVLQEVAGFTGDGDQRLLTEVCQVQEAAQEAAS